MRNSDFGLACLAVQTVETAQQKVVLHARRVQAHDLLVLFDGQADHRFGFALRGALQIADGAQVDASQQTPCVQVVRVAADHVLGLGNGIADVSGAGVELGQRGGQVGGVRIGLQRGFVLVHRFGGVFVAGR